MRVDILSVSHDNIDSSGTKVINTNIFGANFCALGLVVLSGCAMQEKKEAAAAQAMPINCASAPSDEPL
jgi:hypothetical protein